MKFVVRLVLALALALSVATGASAQFPWTPAGSGTGTPGQVWTIQPNGAPAFSTPASSSNVLSGLTGNVGWYNSNGSVIGGNNNIIVDANGNAQYNGKLTINNTQATLGTSDIEVKLDPNHDSLITLDTGGANIGWGLQASDSITLGHGHFAQFSLVSGLWEPFSCYGDGAGTFFNGTCDYQQPTNTDSPFHFVRSSDISPGGLVLDVETQAADIPLWGVDAFGHERFYGSTSGIISLNAQAIAGTYNWNWPTTAGLAGQVLTSQGGGSTAMTWTTPAGGGGSTIANPNAKNLCPWPLPAGVGTGTIYYVSASTGSDSNSGLSPALAWQTIAKVMAKMPTLAPGDEVLFKGGDVWSVPMGLLSVVGSAAHPIVFGHYGAGRPIFDENGQPYGIDACNGGGCNAGSGNGNGTNHDLVIDGFEILHAGFQAITFQTNGGTPSDAVAGSPDSIFDITVQNSYVHNSGPGAPVAGSGNGTASTYNNQIDFESFSQAADNTHFYCNVAQDLGGWNAIEVHYDTGAVDIEGNIAGGNGHACAPHGCIDTKGIGSTFAPAKRLYNTASCGQDEGNCAANEPAMYTENTNSPHSSIIDQGNLIYDSLLGQQVCGGLQGVSCAHAPCNIAYKSYNNTIYSSKSSTYAININDDCAGVATTVTSDVQNDILDGSAESETHSGSSTFNADYNDQGGVQGHGTLTGGFASAETHGIVNVDPQYVNAGAKDFELVTSSPAAGTGNNALTTNNINIGAFGVANAISGAVATPTQTVPQVLYAPASISGGATLTTNAGIPANSLAGSFTGAQASNVLTPGLVCTNAVVCAFQDDTTAGGIKVTARTKTTITFSASVNDAGEYVCGCR